MLKRLDRKARIQLPLDAYVLPSRHRTNMQYVLTGFTNDMDFRVFAFDVVGDQQVRTAYWIRADLRLVRKYGIKLQELPLLCRGVLEERIFVSKVEGTFTYTEAELCTHADARALAAEKLKAARKPANSHGTA